MDINAWAQSRLTAHGYACGVIDGNFGLASIAALRAFQKSQQIAVSGVLDKPTIFALRQPASAIKGAGAAAVAVLREPPVAAVPAARPTGSPEPLNHWPRQSGVVDFYGAVGQHQMVVDLPFPMCLAWDKRRTISRISLHEKVAPSAGRAFRRIARDYDPTQRAVLGIDIFGGSLNVRRMRGGSAYSMHSWGIAIDFDPERNQLKWGRDRARLAQPDAEAFWRAWEDEGWTSLGRARNFDWMHVQAACL